MSAANGNRDRLTACRTQTDKLKDELQGELTNSGIHRGTQTTEIPVAHCREVVYGSLIGEEIYLIEDIEKLTSQLQLVSFCYRENFRHSHVPGIETRKSETAFANVSERVFDARIVTSLKCSRVQPQLA
jgi:hypothetical protein